MDKAMHEMCSQIKNNEFKKMMREKKKDIPPDINPQYINMATNLFVCKICGKTEHFKEGISDMEKIWKKMKAFRKEHSSCS